MIKVMQVGYGYWGTNVAQKLLVSKLFEFVCLAEADEAKRVGAKEKLPDNIKVIEDYREMLSEDIDAVVICTQTEYSFSIAMESMKCGKHVFTEKPIATDIEKTVRLIDEAGANGLVLHCDHLMVYNPVIRYMKEMIDKGEIGDIMYIDISRINLGPIRKDINAMQDLPVHDIAVIDYLIGGLLPQHLNAYGTKIYGKRETITYLTMKCKDILININSSWISPKKVRRMVVAGTKKMLIFDDLKTEKLRIYNSGIDVEQGSVYGEYEYKNRVGDVFMPHIEHEDSLQNSLEYFADCISEGKDSLSGPGQSLRVMKVLEEAQLSLEKNA